MYEEDRLDEIASYVKKIHRWVLFIGVVTILGILLNVCGALVGV